MQWELNMKLPIALSLLVQTTSSHLKLIIPPYTLKSNKGLKLLKRRTLKALNTAMMCG